MATSPESRLASLSRDGNLDLEDLAHVVAAAEADGTITAWERQSLQAGLSRYATIFEPAARAWLQAVIDGGHPPPPNRVLLAPHPRGQAPDRFYPRADAVALQEALGRLGQVVTVDGDYGPGTTRAVSAIQAASSLPVTGVVDTVTLLALNERLDEKGAAALDLTPRAAIRPDMVIAARGIEDPATMGPLAKGLGLLADHFGLAALRASSRFDATTEGAVAAFQSRVFLPATGILDLSTVEALDAALGAIGAAPTGLAQRRASLEGKTELHFYPGVQELRVLRGGQPMGRYAMVGGRPEAAPDPNNPDVHYDPTPAGTYEVASLGPHQSRSWGLSYVPWGARLRDQGGEIWFQDPGGKWHQATGAGSVFAGRTIPPPSRASYLAPDGKVKPRWDQNDFGHLRVMLRDVRTRALQTHMIHSSPGVEQTSQYFAETDSLLEPGRALAVLHWSHGCEHIHPADLDHLVATGAIAPGTRLVVHGYDERPTSLLA